MEPERERRDQGHTLEGWCQAQPRDTWWSESSDGDQPQWRYRGLERGTARGKASLDLEKWSDDTAGKYGQWKRRAVVHQQQWSRSGPPPRTPWRQRRISVEG